MGQRIYEVEVRERDGEVMVIQPSDGYDDQVVLLTITQIPLFIELLQQAQSEATDALV